MAGYDALEAEEASAPSGKRNSRGALVAAIALAAVLVAAFFGYRALGIPDSPAADIADRTEAAEASASDALMLSSFDSTVYTEYGDARKLSQIADGKPLVMNFWATWCPYCVQEMDDYQNIYDDYSDRVSFAFIDCADGTRETVEQGAGWLYENEYTLPAYFDTKQEAQYTFGATALPTTVVVSAEGEIMTITAGAIDPDLMRSALDSLLEA